MICIYAVRMLRVSKVRSFDVLYAIFNELLDNVDIVESHRLFTEDFVDEAQKVLLARILLFHIRQVVSYQHVQHFSQVVQHFLLGCLAWHVPCTLAD